MADDRAPVIPPPAQLAGSLPSRPSRPVVVKTPEWSRPDDAERQARLDAMKWRATALLAIAAGVFLIALWLEPTYAWMGYVRATAEASLVGGLADWFAVTALFRHPLGLPIPHTAIVATRKERIGRILGTFVQNHFLSRDVIGANLRAVQPAARAAEWLRDPAHTRQMSRQMAAALAKTLEALPDREARELFHQVLASQVRGTKVAPTLGKAAALVVAGDHHQGLLNEALRLAAQAIAENREFIRERVRKGSPWWVPGAVDDKIYRAIVDATEGQLRAIIADPNHPARAKFDAALRTWIDELQNSAEVIARAEAMKEEWLAGSAAGDLSGRLWEATRTAITGYAARADATPDDAPGPLESGLSEFGEAMLSNEALLSDIDDVVVDVVSSVVERYRQEIGDLIAQTVAGWDPEATSRRFELAVGRDLQFVRINGTIVGGLVGLGIYVLTHR